MMATFIRDILTGSKASQLPWKISIEEEWNGQESYWIESANGNRVADQIEFYPTAVAENDMRAIVQAINSHDTIMEALEAVKRYLNLQGLYDTTIYNIVDEALDAGRVWDDK